MDYLEVYLVVVETLWIAPL